MPGESFQLKLDIQRCKREDITVEMDGNCLVINTRKFDPEDNSIVARKFSKRMYPISDKFDKSTLKYEFDENGMLLVRIERRRIENTT